MRTPDAQTAACVFCAIVRGEAPATFVHQDEVVVAFMDIRPVQPGHLLVVPRAHAELIPELEAIADQIRPGTSQSDAPDISGR